MRRFLVLTLALFAAAEDLPRNCRDIQLNAAKRSEKVENGVFTIYPWTNGEDGIEVFCDMQTSEGGWTVIQRRWESQPQQDFYRGWEEYVYGFGVLHDSHWRGLELLSTLTNADDYTLRIDMTDLQGEERYVEYSTFRVSNSTDDYRLTVNGYSGNAGESLINHNGMKFTTKDRDNDNVASNNCAQLYHGAWWYNKCHISNLNGLYGSVQYGRGVNWREWHGYYYSLKRVEMKIRTVN